MFSRITARIRSWEFFAQAISFLLVCDLLLMGPQFFRLFGIGGVIDREILVQATDGLPLSVWPVLARFGMASKGSDVLFGLFALTALLSAGTSLLPKWRFLRPLLYLTYVVLKQSIGLGTYGVHEFLQIALFYLALWGMFGKAEANARWIAFAFRWHLSLAYMFAGLSKAMGHQWWSGEAIWRSMNRSDASGFRLFDITQIVQAPIFYQAIAWATLFFETLYPLAYFKRLRPIFVGAMISMHLGILCMQGLIIFAPTMIVLNIFFLLSAREWEAESADSEPEVAELATV